MASALVATLAGCSSAISGITNAVEGKEDVFSIRVGDCFDNPSEETAEEVESVKMPKCTEPHDNEAFFIYDVSDSDFPAYDQDAVIADAEEKCRPEYEQFVGVPEAETSIYFSYYFPSDESWEQGDREILCMVFDENGPVSESLEGKGAEYPLS